MGLWSRTLSAFRAFKSSSDAVLGSELFGALDGMGLSLAGVNVNSYSAMTHVAVMACTAILSEDVAKLPLHVWKRLAKGGREVATAHPLEKLLRRPNAWQTRFEFVEMMQAALILRGNAYAAKVTDGYGDTLFWVPLHPDQVQQYIGPDGQIFYFVTRRGFHDTAMLASLPLMIPADNMLHLRWLSTWNSLMGMSRIQMMREPIGLSMSQEQMAARVAGSGARPGGILTTDKKLGKEAREELIAAWQGAQGGMRNAGKTAVLEQGLKWQALGMTLVDAEFMDSRRFSLEDICRGFRVPKYKLGIGDEGTGTSLVQKDQGYLNDVLSAYCDRWTARLEADYEIDGDEYFVAHDYSHFLKADVTTRLNAIRTGILSMVLTPNEARRGENLPEEEGGDVLFRPANMVPIDTPVAATPPAGGGVGSDTTGGPAAGGDGDPASTPGPDAPS